VGVEFQFLLYISQIATGRPRHIVLRQTFAVLLVIEIHGTKYYKYYTVQCCI